LRRTFRNGICEKEMVGCEKTEFEPCYNYNRAAKKKKNPMRKFESEQSPSYYDKVFEL
jgi:hypothetical protein